MALPSYAATDPPPEPPPGRSAHLGDYYWPAEVARILLVSPKTIARYAKEGKLPCARTIGGHRRFPGPAIRDVARRLAIYDGMETDSSGDEEA